MQSPRQIPTAYSLVVICLSVANIGFILNKKFKYEQIRY